MLIYSFNLKLIGPGKSSNKQYSCPTKEYEIHGFNIKMITLKIVSMLQTWHTTMIAILPPTSPTTFNGGFSLACNTERKYTFLKHII